MLGDVDTLEGDTAGVTMIAQPDGGFNFSPNGQYPIGSFQAQRGQVYKVTVVFDVLATGSAPAGPGVYLFLSASNAGQPHFDSAVLCGSQWRACMMGGFLVAEADGDVSLTLTTTQADLSAEGSILGLRVIVETLSA